MVALVSFPEAVEGRARFVEETAPGAIVEQTLERLRGGADPLDLITAAALAVSRSTELPPDHHGGPIHPVAGVHAVAAMTRRLQGEEAYLPTVQCLALANKHIHLPSMGPGVMVEFEDLAGRVEAPEKSLARLGKALADRQPRLAERALVSALAGGATPGAILDTLMAVAVPRNSLDDHYFLYPLYCARALDAIGWDWAPVLLRGAVRYLARHTPFEPFGEFTRESIEEGMGFYRRQGELEDLIVEHGLNEETVRRGSGPDEDGAIAALADAIGTTDFIAGLPPVLARALGDGLSLDGLGEALSIGGARLFLRSHSANPFDVHIHTGVSVRRYLLGFKAVGLRHKLLAFLGWPWGYEVRYLDHTLTWDWLGGEDDLSGKMALGPEALLSDIENRILALLGYDVSQLTQPINDTVADDEVREIVRLGEAYAKAGYDPEALFRLTTGLVCREDVSEMHAYKMQQAAYEEYHACRAPHRWVHLASAVKQAAVVAPLLPRRVYPRARAVLAA